MSGPALIASQLARSRTGRKILFALLGLPGAVLLAPLLAVMAGSGPTGSAPSLAAQRAIPQRYFIAYQRAAAQQHLDWAIVAAVGSVECNHGRSQLPGCNPIGSVNSAGASGPMQFLATTWRFASTPGISPPAGPPTPSNSQGYASDGDNDGIADVWNINDAALAAARLLHANGAPVDYQRALYAYNHSAAYVTRVLRIAESYRAGAPVAATAGMPGSWALAYLGTAYVWGGNHTGPDSQLGSAQPTPKAGLDGRVGFFDCSSLISWAYAKARGLWVGGTTGEQWQIAGEATLATRGYGAPPGGWQAGDIGFYEALSHVVLALSPSIFIEAPQTGADIRLGLFSQRGVPYGYVHYPDPPPSDERPT